MKRVAIHKRGGLLLLSILFLGASVSFAEAQQTSSNEKTVQWKIDGMSCKLCAARIEKKLMSLCHKAEVNFEKNFGSCLPKTGHTPQEALKVIEDMGFEAQVLSPTQGKKNDE